MNTRKEVTLFKWNIENFDQFVNDSKTRQLKSKKFELNEDSGSQFYIEVDRRAFNHHWIHLVCENFQKTKIKTNVTFWLENSIGHIFGKQSKEEVFTKDKNLRSCFLCRLNRTESLIINDSFFICFEIKHNVQAYNFEYGIKETAREQLQTNIGKLYLSGVSDLTIRAGGKEFKALKHVMMAYSDVFMTMLFSPNYIEAKTGIIKIDDIRADIVEAMIRWLHVFELENLDVIANELFKAAHKYSIRPLMNECLKSMSRHLYAKNMLSCLVLAYIYDEEEFKERVIEFVRRPKNMYYLMNSNEWSELEIKDGELAKRILDDLKIKF